MDNLPFWNTGALGQQSMALHVRSALRNAEIVVETRWSRLTVQHLTETTLSRVRNTRKIPDELPRGGVQMWSCMLGWFSTSYRGFHPVWANSERPHTLRRTLNVEIGS